MPKSLHVYQFFDTIKLSLALTTDIDLGQPQCWHPRCHKLVLEIQYVYLVSSS